MIPARGGLPMAEYTRRQRPVPRRRDRRPVQTPAAFMARAQTLYGYPEFHLRHWRVNLRMDRP